MAKDKIYKQNNTGVLATFEEEAKFFKPVRVLLEVHYARTKNELEAGENIHSRLHDISISEGMLTKLMEVHSQAIEQK